MIDSEVSDLLRVTWVALSLYKPPILMRWICKTLYLVLPLSCFHTQSHNNTHTNLCDRHTEQPRSVSVPCWVLKLSPPPPKRVVLGPDHLRTSCPLQAPHPTASFSSKIITHQKMPYMLLLWRDGIRDSFMTIQLLVDIQSWRGHWVLVPCIRGES